MPPIEAVTSVTDARGAGAADNELLSALTMTASSPFRTVLEANSLQSTSLAEALEAVNPLGETSLQTLQDPSDGDTPPAELLAILLNMLAPAVTGLPSQSNTADSPPVVLPSGASQSSENLTTAALALANDRQDGETIAEGTPAQISLGANPFDTRTEMAQDATSAVITTPPPVSLSPKGMEGMREEIPQVTLPGARHAFIHIPAQAPVVSNLLPSLGIPGEVVLEVPEPVGAVEVQIGLPSMQVGERPSVAGNRIALVAEMGAQLASSTPVDSSAFAQQFHHLSSHLPENSAVAGGISFPTELPDSPGSEVIAAQGGANNSGSGPVAANPQGTLGWAEGTTPTSTVLLANKPITGGEIPEQTLTAIKAHLHQLNQEGEVEFRMHLHPTELGPLRVHLSVREGEIHGQLYVLDDTLRRLLQDQLPELRHRLEALGLSLGQWEIAPDQSSHQADTLWSSWQESDATPKETPSMGDNRKDFNLATTRWTSHGHVYAEDDGRESNHVDVIV
ncbi:MAG: hypothetical protein KatS3mg107_0737 [Gemmataceae bacterium]|nr:MAG: hypothetical protein KatS3mg107_0737 [Gemmataceae bacterium]